MKIHLDETDAPVAADRETAERIITEIICNDVITKGSFVIEGYSAARRIAQALTAARIDERRRGFATPFRMRRTRAATGAPAVMAKWPYFRPLYHSIEVEGFRLQSYRAALHDVPMISDDARIIVRQHGGDWVATIDGAAVIMCGLTRRFASAQEAARAAMAKLGISR